MTEWKEEADEAIAHNLADVAENGPRLAWGRKTAVIAIDRAHKRVLETGLGVLGVGTMWVSYDSERKEWGELPEQHSRPELDTRVHLVVTYNDHTVNYFPVEGGWKIDNPHRCLVVGRGLPRTYIPLDQVRSFNVEECGGDES